MSNLAYLPGHKPQEQPQEGASKSRGPQVEDGYTRIANELFEALIQAPLTDRERRVALAVIRLTYGWNKKADRIADSQIADVAHLPRQKVNKTKQQLVAKKVLKIEGAGHGLLSINKHYEEWQFTAHHTPKQRGDKKGDTVPHGGDKECTPRGCTPKTKDITTTSYEVERSGKPESADSASDESPAKLPACPHMAIIDLWAEIMPDKTQPTKNMWASSQRARHLAARWKAGFTIKHEKTGELLYTDRETGLDWWRRFFGFLRKSDFLMGDNRWFKLDWVAKKENFVKIMEMAYHDGGES
jgi:phage replication O-like protein O